MTVLTMRRVFLTLLCLATAIHARSLCDLSADDGILCVCRDTEARCEPTRPLESLVPAAHKLPYENAKRRRDARTINTLFLQSAENRSFLQKFPKDIFEEPLHFKIVNIAHAKLSVLSSYTVYGSDYLRELTMSDCEIMELQRKAIVGLTNLLKLDLSSNLMTTFKTGVLSGLPLLEELTIAHSEINDIEPHAFVELRSLKSLSLKDNKVTYIDNQLLTGLNQLEKIDLSFNYLEKVDDKTFVDLPKLTHVDLSGNRLLSVTPKTFKGMYALQSLSLYYNDFTSLPDGFLQDSPKLKHLNLRRNHLETVTLDMLHGLKVIRPDFTLDLRNNPLNCSCDLYYLTELRKRRLAVMENEFEDPPEFQNLQCLIHDGGALEPRVLDNEVFVSNECQQNPGFAQHIAPLAISSQSSSSTSLSNNESLRPVFMAILAVLLCLRLV